MRAAFESVTVAGPTSFACRTFDLPAFPFRWHFHNEYELTLILESRGKRFVGDHIGDYREGDLVLLGKDLPHTWHSEPGRPRGGRARAVVVQFRGSFLGEDFFRRPEMQPVARLLDESAQGLRFTGRAREAAAARMTKMQDMPPFERLMELLAVLGILAEGDRQTISSRHYTPPVRPVDRQRLDRILRFVNGRSASGVSVGEAAKVAHMSESAFGRFFRKASGRSFTAYVNELRIGSACRDLLETDRRIADIAFAAGFNNLSNFNRRFRELKGLSPRDYRSQVPADAGGG